MSKEQIKSSVKQDSTEGSTLELVARLQLAIAQAADSGNQTKADALQQQLNTANIAHIKARAGTA